MSFNFHEIRKPRRTQLFIPRSAFSFASFVVPIKFRQPGLASTTVFSIGREARIFPTYSQTRTRPEI
jgi:hypothetical protein